MKQVPLTQGYVAIVDDEDFEAISKHKWHVHDARGKKYARRSFKYPGIKKTGKEYMHHAVLGRSDYTVDHRNGDGLDNRRANLRWVTKKENQGNSKLRKDNTSGYKGVQPAYYKRADGQQGWYAFCAKRRIGKFRSPQTAAVAYDCAAIAEFGEAAKTNHDVWRYITGNDLIVALERGWI